MLSVKNMSISYSHVNILNDISFHINEREIVSLLGSNGAGKTSIVMGVTGLIALKHGTTIFLSRDITKMEPHERVKMGLVQVPEDKCLFTELTVLDNLKLGAYVAYVTPAPLSALGSQAGIPCPLTTGTLVTPNTLDAVVAPCPITLPKALPRFTSPNISIALPA